MKNYVSLNFEYYKNSQAKSRLDHIDRSTGENCKNAIANLSKNNIYSTENFHSTYLKTLAFAKNNTKEKTGRSFQSNSANTFLDGVLAFSYEQFLEFQKNPNWKEIIVEKLNLLMREIEKETGFMPLGWALHLDEGHREASTGCFKLNVHAHLVFMNHCSETGKAPLRCFQRNSNKAIWSRLQTTAGNVFAPCGFVRGVSKDSTGLSHLKRQQYIDKTLNKQKQLTDELILETKAALAMADHAQERLDVIISRIRQLENNVEELEILEDSKLRSHLSYLAKLIEKSYFAGGYFKKLADSLLTKNPAKYEEIKVASTHVMNALSQQEKISCRKAEINEIELSLVEISEEIKERLRPYNKIATSKIRSQSIKPKL